ncbi:hypothetical protein ACS127_12675 [Amphibacillus sp. Q70]|uniref:hypothetical protein n=1 Tax=Amphibacillus sp. Q70 TaxID=3453416 RepID=UPI003F82BDF4
MVQKLNSSIIDKNEFQKLVHKNASTLFENKNECLLLLDKYISRKFKRKFSWGIFFLYLRSMSKADLDITDWNLATQVELFIISTDILDDIMDKDSDLLAYTHSEMQTCKEIIYVTLNNLGYKLRKNELNVLEINLMLSLSYQFLDLFNTIDIYGLETDYFSIGTNKSVYLGNAIVQLAWEEGKLEITEFSKFFALSNQINNDIENIVSKKASDLVQHKATLPIIKAFHAADTDELNILNDFFSDNNNCSLEKVRQIIINSGAIEYSR